MVGARTDATTITLAGTRLNYAASNSDCDYCANDFRHISHFYSPLLSILFCVIINRYDDESQNRHNYSYTDKISPRSAIATEIG